jgi:transposase
LRFCQNCRIHRNRDCNAASNIASVLRNAFNGLTEECFKVDQRLARSIVLHDMISTA